MDAFQFISQQNLWITIGTLIAGGIIYHVFCGVRADFRNEREKKRLAQEPVVKQIAEQVSQRLILEQDKRLDEIERKLTNDKQTLEIHTRPINELYTQTEDMGKDIKAICQGMFALLNKASGLETAKEIEEARKAFAGRLMEK